MANYTFHYMIATHEDKSKVIDLYHHSYTMNFFEKIFPRPAEFINDTKNLEYPKIFVSDRLARWRSKNWGGNEWPSYKSGDFSKLSKSSTIFTTRFALRAPVPAPFGIYDELSRQGFRVKAYYLRPEYFCGSYIYGVHEHIDNYRDEGQDVPEDIDSCFRIQYYDCPRKTALILNEKEYLNEKENGETHCNTILPV